jgi:opacity protein-like surface antigen
MELRKNNSKSKMLIVLFIASFFIYTSNSFAQKIEITPFYGYQLNGKVIGYEGDLNIRDAASYGAMIDITVQRGMQVELYYSRSDTRGDFVAFRGPTYRLTDLSVNYFQIGFLRTVKKVKNVTLYGIGSLGATLFAPSGESYNETPRTYYFEDWWLFSITAGGGAKVWLSEKVGLRFEGRVMMPITWAGGGFMVGTGGSGFYLGRGSAILQASM